MEIDGRVAVVSGAGSGIGRASALVLARAGARVVVADIGDGAGQETVVLIRDRGGVAEFVHVDVGIEEEIRRMLAAAEELYGGLHILHNNAGILTAGARFPKTPPDRFMRVVDINLRGVMLATYHAIPIMHRSGGGVIVQTASSAAVGPHRLHPEYAASKAGALNFTRSLTYLEEDYGIRVACICPGLVRTSLAAHAAAAMPPEDREAFVQLRSALRERPHLEAEKSCQLSRRRDVRVHCVGDGRAARRVLRTDPGPLRYRGSRLRSPAGDLHAWW
ncbi:MAG: SDR family NAD(P)-dependent oxidoreductase [Dehalococcoidia bacterium]